MLRRLLISQRASRMRLGLALAMSVSAIGIQSATGAPQSVLPGADGTIVDGGSYGAFDGVADTADWIFNKSSYEGAITLSRRMPGFEYRVVFEYDLTAAKSLPAVAATLTFTLRGGTRFPADPTPVQVRAYPADVIEELGDFSAGPDVVVATRSVAARQASTTYTINVTAPVVEAVAGGARGIGFRFQISPDVPGESSQAFMDITDAEPTTKPMLTIMSRLPGDLDEDGDVDLQDYKSLSECVQGPGTSPVPTCVLSDFDADSDVDLNDVSTFFRLPTLVPTP